MSYSSSSRAGGGRSLPGELGAATLRVAVWAGGLIRLRVEEIVGGPARARVITLFAMVLALSSADSSTIGAVAPQLDSAFHTSNAEIGLLTSVTLLAGGAMVLPIGMIVDRARRVPMLAGSVVLWSIASFLSALAGSYTMLLLSRLAMGAVTATAGPAIASLTGDYFPSRERGRVWSYILAGEIIGTAIGFTLMTNVASAISWRASFVLLAIPGFFLARSLFMTVPEPRRGGQSRLEPGALELRRERTEHSSEDLQWADDDLDAQNPEGEFAHHVVRAKGIQPDYRRVLRVSPREMSIGQAVRYVLSIPTNRLLIISSALGYFYFSGLLTFVVLFVRYHYHVSQGTLTLVLLLLVAGAFIGTVTSGRLTDAMVRRGRIEARIVVPAVCYVLATVLLIPGLVSTSLTPAVWFDVAGVALISAANPPLDAARLDIIPAQLWGRAESTRTLLRSTAQALAPLLFGAVADLINGFYPEPAPIGTRVHRAPTQSNVHGIEITFLIMLVALAGACWFLAQARRTYARDVATAAASQDAAQAARRGGSRDPGAAGRPRASRD